MRCRPSPRPFTMAAGSSLRLPAESDIGPQRGCGTPLRRACVTSIKAESPLSSSIAANFSPLGPHLHRCLHPGRHGSSRKLHRDRRPSGWRRTRAHPASQCRRDGGSAARPLTPDDSSHLRPGNRERPCVPPRYWAGDPWVRFAANDNFRTYEAPIKSDPGRYLWVTVELSGNTRATPRPAPSAPISLDTLPAKVAEAFCATPGPPRSCFATLGTFEGELNDWQGSLRRPPYPDRIHQFAG